MHNEKICIKCFFFELVDAAVAPVAAVAFVVFISSLFLLCFFLCICISFNIMRSWKIQWPIEIQLDFITIVRFTCLLEHSMFWCQFSKFEIRHFVIFIQYYLIRFLIIIFVFHKIICRFESHLVLDN